MSNFPTAIDAAPTLYSPVDAFSTKPLETTANGAAAVVNDDVKSEASVPPVESATPPLPPETVRVYVVELTKAALGVSVAV